MPDDTSEHLAKKPKITSSPPTFTAPPGERSDLLSRLNEFLPELQAANATLDPSRNMEELDSEDEQYIEMNLGLGVLKQIRPGQTDVSSDEEFDSSSDDDEEESEKKVDSTQGADDDSAMGDVEDPPLALLMSSKRHGKGPRGEPLLSEVRETAASPTPRHPEDHAGHGERPGKEKEMTLEKLLMSSKRHGKGPRGKPVIEEVEETANTPTPEQQEIEERRRRRSSVNEPRPTA
ncbi:hypothetical protein EX30DRAFT_360799 [Ascodesmis nigricans]|uniref:Uncharacterized protein n=1 Tax=Ascodesmis nigricans TaxID=341454 RepID=A0A4S2N6B6_9PEZI|nr:hypothetical protein EX30DRAFT_360799 [Ascodesmis nigricans]